VCEPFKTPSLGGNKYFLIFVDEFTRKFLLYLLKEKKQVFSLFKKWLAKTERRSGGGGEFNSNELNEFCDAEGVEHEVTTPYTPQHNSLAERRNRTLLDMTRCMLKSKGLPNRFWGEAVITAAHVLNKYPTKRIKSVTSEEAWSGKKPIVLFWISMLYAYS